MKLFESRCAGPPIGAGVDPPILPIRPRSRRRTFDRKVWPRSGDWKTILPGRVCYSCPRPGLWQNPGTRWDAWDWLCNFGSSGPTRRFRDGKSELRPPAEFVDSPSVGWRDSGSLPGPADDPFRLGIADRLHLSCSYGGTFSNSLIVIASLSSRFGNSSGRRRKPNCRCLRRLHTAHDVVWRLERPISVTGVFAL